MGRSQPIFEDPLSVLGPLPMCPDTGNLDIKTVHEKLFSHIKDVNEVPLLTHKNAHQFSNGALVRVVGQVQDMLNPEYIVGSFQSEDGSWTSCHLHDKAHAVMPRGASTRYDERRPVFITQPSGQSAWFTEAAMANVINGFELGPTQAKSRNTIQKRCRENEDAMEEDEEGSESLCITSTDGARPCPMNGHIPLHQSPPETVNESQAAIQLPEGCLVYIPSVLKTPLLNEIVTVIGTLSTLPEFAAAEFEGSESADLGAAHPPTSRCPRIHVISVMQTTPAVLSQSPWSQALVEQARSGLLAMLGRVLGGDAVAAEYLLLQLVARVASRRQDSGLVGICSLNLTQLPAESPQPASALSTTGQALSTILQAVAPRVVPLSMSIDKLNARPWWPMRHQTLERLLPGHLQLAKGTQVLLDETVMSSGTLSEVGIRNLQAIDSLIRSQRVSYGFEFFELEQEADAPVIVLSCGRSMLKDAIDIWVPLSKESFTKGANAEELLSDFKEQLPLFRSFLTYASQLDFSIPPELATSVEKDLADARQKDASITPEALHTRLNVARLMAHAHGQETLTSEIWRSVNVLQGRRAERAAAAVTPGQ